MSNRNLWDLADLKEPSQLKSDLNLGVASLKFAPEEWFQPHVCLNGKEGLAVIERIAERPETANTAFEILNHVIVSGDDLWLNVQFRAFLDQRSFPSEVVDLTPRQTAYIVERLPPESRALVLGKVQTWYFDHFRKNVLDGLNRIAAQFEGGDPLLKSDRENHIFDIHGGRCMDIPYAEWGIAGYELFGTLFHGTCLDHDKESYDRLDGILNRADKMRKDTAEGMLELVRAIGR